jgi:hypothetical protein
MRTGKTFNERERDKMSENIPHYVPPNLLLIEISLRVWTEMADMICDNTVAEHYRKDVDRYATARNDRLGAIKTELDQESNSRSTLREQLIRELQILFRINPRAVINEIYKNAFCAFLNH